MRKTLYTEFNTRQYMTNTDYEIFYYHDNDLHPVSAHSHKHMEFYFFLEGDLDYEIGGIKYKLKTGDFMLIPPGKKHQPHIQNKEKSYRRIILWISKEFYYGLCQSSKDFSYGYDYVIENNHYHFRPDFTISHDIHGKLIDLLEESRSDLPFQKLHSHLKISYFLASINRIIYELTEEISISQETPLYIRICDYINRNITKNLSLDYLSKEFHLSKYHMAHTFKDNMGISLHQYITKKKLQAIKSVMLSDIPINHIATNYGYNDYTSFYRAFKKEYGVSPQEYKDFHPKMEEYKTDKPI